jgi:hypothetical protein
MLSLPPGPDAAGSATQGLLCAHLHHRNQQVQGKLKLGAPLVAFSRFCRSTCLNTLLLLILVCLTTLQVKAGQSQAFWEVSHRQHHAQGLSTD